MKYKQQKIAGFTLIEILIAVIILSIGLLGMAGIQLKGLRGTTSSTLRSEATILANDIAERARINPAGLAIGSGNENVQYSIVDTSKIDCVNGKPNQMCSSDSTIANDAAVDSCTTQQMAAFDIFVFACGLGGDGGVNNLLPPDEFGNPVSFATIACNANLGCPPGSELTINVNWSDLAPNGTTINKTVTMVFVP
jgi:type IV pilus assembly protein PilV